MAKTTLILGAGLGKEYGFPTGIELRQIIINRLPQEERELKHIFMWATAETVDEIAAKHPQHAHTIRKLVTKIIFEGEDLAKLQQNERPNTYKLMLRQIAISLANRNQVEVLTFNYDRSLQCLLYEVNKTEPSNQIPEDTIKTIYGRLSPLFHEEKSSPKDRHYHSYGIARKTTAYNPNNLSNIDYELTRARDLKLLEDTSTIKFIEEKNLKTDHDISETLHNSDQIFFLGVGYHEPNMRILSFDLTKRHPNKLIAGTGYGLSEDERNYLLRKYPAIDYILDCDAFTFLKTKFSISDPGINITKTRLPRKRRVQHGAKE